MKKKLNFRVTTDGAKGFFDRARDHARKLDRGEALVPEVTISFENPGDMLRVLSAGRIRLLDAARRKPSPVSDLAQWLNRDARAVSRDVDLLERFGLLSSHYQRNPGHGRRRVVVPRAAKYELIATI
jgi:predicted transcriptional regulator